MRFLLAIADSNQSLFGSWRWGEIFLELAAIAILALFAYLILTGFNGFVTRVYRGRGSWRSAVLRMAPLVRFAIFALLAVSIGSILFGLSRPVLILSMVAFAIALGLASVDLVANVVSGAVIGLQRPFKINDRVQIGEMEGDILRIGIRSTSLRTNDGRIVHIPNRRFISDVVVNSSLNGIGSPTLVEIPLPMGIDIAVAKDIAQRAGAISKFSSPRRRPHVRVIHNLHHIATSTGKEPPLALELLVYAFNPRFEEQLQGEIIEIVNEGVLIELKKVRERLEREEENLAEAS